MSFKRSGSTIRSTPKHDLGKKFLTFYNSDNDLLLFIPVGGSGRVIHDNLDNSKDLYLDDSLNMSHMQVSRRSRAVHNNTLNTSYITNALNTSMHRIKPQSQSPGKQPQFIFLPKEPVSTKPTTFINP